MLFYTIQQDFVFNNYSIFLSKKKKSWERSFVAIYLLLFMILAIRVSTISKYLRNINILVLGFYILPTVKTHFNVTSLASQVDCKL